jgi:hypothetical protein
MSQYLSLVFTSLYRWAATRVVTRLVLRVTHPRSTEIANVWIDLTRFWAGVLIFTVACGSDATAATVTAGSGAGTGQVAASTGGSTSSGGSAGNLVPPAAGGGSGMQASSGRAATPAAGGGANASGAGGANVSGSGATGTGTAGVAGAAGSGGPVSTTRFSFFVTSYVAMQRLSRSPNGFGGDLRFGKPDGLSGADEICRQIAETSLPGAGTNAWRAFLSVTKGPDGKAVNAIDRVGSGPWYDRLGRLVAMNKADLGQVRPKGADSAIINDLPNEDGVPNHAPSGNMQVDNHDVLTGSSSTGTLYNTDWSVTCHDWTSSVGSDGKPRVGHSWPRMGGPGGGGGGGGGMNNWMSALDEAGCAAGASLVEMGGPIASNPTVGSGGGYGGIYCFALTP